MLVRGVFEVSRFLWLILVAVPAHVNLERGGALQGTLWSTLMVVYRVHACNVAGGQGKRTRTFSSGCSALSTVLA